MIIRWAGQSHVGLLRESNEDAYSLDPATGIFLVSDGMGGHNAGEIAAGMTAMALPDLLQKYVNPRNSARPVIHGIERAVAEVGRNVLNVAENTPSMRGMGATLVLAMLMGKTAFIAHVGDSRAYLLHKNNLEQITRDHSLVQELVDAEKLTPEAAHYDPRRNVITRCIGCPGVARPSVRRTFLHRGDRLLLCSDGLSDMLTHDKILELVSQESDPAAACSSLIFSANAAGGKDNITTVIIDRIK